MAARPRARSSAPPLQQPGTSGIRRRGRPPSTDTASGATPRETLVGSAMALMYERGFHAMTLAELAERAGMQKGHVSHYFPSKQAVLEAVVEQHIEQTLRWLEEGIEAVDDAQGRAKAAVHRIMDYVVSHEPDLTRWGCPLAMLALECGRLASQDPALGVGRQPLLRMEAWLAEKLSPALGQRQAEKHAEHILCALQGASVLAQAHEDPGPLRRLLTTLQAKPLPTDG